MEVFKMFDREDGSPCGAYSRAYTTEYDFPSASSARNSNCHGIFKDKVRYRVAKYKVTYELLDDDVDPPTPDDYERSRERDARQEAFLSIFKEVVDKELKGNE